MNHTPLRRMTAAAALAASLALAAPAGAAERSPARAYLDGARVWLGELLTYALGLDRGALRSTSGDVGPDIDPNGLAAVPADGDVGPYIDPDGAATTTDFGPTIDPDGAATTTDLGPEMDPNG